MREKGVRLKRLKKALLSKQDLLKHQSVNCEWRLLEVRNAARDIEKAMAAPVMTMLDFWQPVVARIVALRLEETAIDIQFQAVVHELIQVKGQLRRTEATHTRINSMEERKAMQEAILEDPMGPQD